jgi:predicted anti-sigma-YlaC factor YlaD
VTCEKIRKKLSAYVVRQLSDTEMSEIAHHLSHCSNCRAELQREERLVSILKTDKIPQLSPDLTTRILTQGRQRLEGKRVLSRRSFLPYLYVWESMPGYMRAAAAVILIFGLTAGTLLGLSVSSEEEQPAEMIATLDSDPASIYHLDYFSDVPNGSLPQAYQTLSSVPTEGGR